MRQSSYLFAFVVLTQSQAVAAPPKLDYLYPAGAQRGTTVEITATGTFNKWPVAIWTDHKDVVVNAAKTKGKLQVKVDPDAMPGICWLRVHDKQGASNLRLFLIGNLPEALEREPNDSPTKPQTLDATTVVVNGRFAKRGDVDVFALSLRKGQALIAALQGNEVLNSPMDAVLQIVSADGFVLEQNDDTHGMDPQIVFNVPSDGRYFVRTFAFPATPNSTIGFAGDASYVYRLTLTTAGFADHAWPLAVSSAKDKVGVIGWNVPKEAAGLSLLIGDDSDVATVRHPKIANVVRARIEPHAAIIETNDKAPQRVEIPVTISGQITEPGEVDAYEFTLKKGERITAEIDASAVGSPLDPVLSLKDAAGKILQSTQSTKLGADPSLKIAATADAKYRIEVGDLYDHAGLRYVYRLRLSPPIADFALSVKADRFTVAPGKSLEIPITIDRQNGFKSDIEISADGLPGGISVKPIVAAARSKSAKLQLFATEKASPGAFRIIGKAVKENKQRAARAAISELSTSTSHLWITPTTSAK